MDAPVVGAFRHALDRLTASVHTDHALNVQVPAFRQALESMAASVTMDQAMVTQLPVALRRTLRRFTTSVSVDRAVNLAKEAPFEVQNDPAHVVLFACTLVSIYFQYRSMSNPNPPPTAARVVKDVTGMVMPRLLKLQNLVLLLNAMLHAVYTILRPSRSSQFCPAPGNLAQQMFEWSLPNVLGIAATTMGGVIRVIAYTQLGKNFTFMLVKPSTLVTTGIYRYIQHPSYLAVAICVYGFWLIGTNPAVGMGCFMPEILRSYGTLLYVLWVGLTLVTPAIILPSRVKKEEAMLHQAFGKEWEDYNRETARFLPYLL